MRGLTSPRALVQALLPRSQVVCMHKDFVKCTGSSGLKIIVLHILVVRLMYCAANYATVGEMFSLWHFAHLVDYERVRENR